MKTNYYFLAKVLRAILFGVTALLLMLPIQAQTYYTVGAGAGVNSGTTYPTPYGDWWQGARHQYLVTKAELNAAGIVGACKIISLGFNVKTASGETTRNLTISMGATAAAALTTTFSGGLTTVFGPTSYADVTGWSQHNFNVPFCWDGLSNIVIDVCSYTNPGDINNAVVYNSTTAFNSDHYIADDANDCGAADIGSNSAEGLNTLRPNMKFGVVSSLPDIAAASAYTSKPVTATGGVEKVILSFMNSSCPGTTFNSAAVGYSLNGGAPVIEAWAGALAVNTATTYTFTTTITASVYGYNSLKIWVNKPNGLTPDANTANDTIMAHFFVTGNSPAPTIIYASTDYWAEFPHNPDGATATTYDVVINSVYCAHGEIVFPNIGGSINTTPFSITPNTSKTITLPQVINGVNVYNSSPNSIRDNGFNVVADSAISVSLVPHTPASVDGEFMLPTSMLGNYYVVQGRNETFGPPAAILHPPEFTVGAVQQNTNITIYNNVTGLATNVILNAGQTYMTQSGAINCQKDQSNIIPDANDSVYCGTLNGSLVFSDKPIYVISHTDCSNMGYCGACDFLMGEMLPVNLWSTKYIVAQAMLRGSANQATCLPVALPTMYSMADFVEVVGLAGTSVTFTNSNGANTKVIPAFGTSNYGYLLWVNPPIGAGAETNGEADMVITATQPVQVFQYGQGYQGDNTNKNTDPEQMLIYPENFWTSEYLFSTSSALTSLNNIVIVVYNPGATVNGFIIDGGAQAPTGWQAIGATGYKFKRISLTYSTAAHYVKNTTGLKFGIYVNATSAAESYTIQSGNSPLRLPLLASCSPALMAVGLVNFSGKSAGPNNFLTWTSGSETNSGYYAVERGPDGMFFNEIGRIPFNNKGNSNTGNAYSFTDVAPLNGDNVYRLRKVGQDNRSEYSNAIDIYRKALFVVNKVTYKKENGIMVINYSAPKEQEISVNIYDLTGRLAHTNLVHINPGMGNTININVAGLPEGAYIMSIVSDDNSSCYNNKIVVY